LGVAGFFAGWSQPEKMIIKPTKQARVQVMRFFFMIVQSIFRKDVKMSIGLWSH
jgi:hypothetical protein